MWNSVLEAQRFFVLAAEIIRLIKTIDSLIQEVLPFWDWTGQIETPPYWFVNSALIFPGSWKSLTKFS